MKIVNAFPPNYKEIQDKFHPAAGTVFTWGDTIYTPNILFPLSADLIVHEETHSGQQGGLVEQWWEKYLNDAKFRFNQEVEAYRNQWRAYCENANREQKRRFLPLIARDLASSMYGNIVTFEEAKEVIRY